MIQSETKPRVVTKNLEDIIKQSTFSTKRNSIDDMLKCQHNPNTEPRNKNPGEKHQRCKTNAFNQESEQKNSLSMSKHSLASKEKITVNGIDKQKTKHPRINYSNNKNSSSQLKPNNKEMVGMGKLREKKSIPNNTNTTKENQSLYFNHVDVIFTELEDFLRESRESVLTVFNQQHCTQNKQSKNEMTKEMEQLFLVFKQELQRLIKKYNHSKALKQNYRKQGSLLKKSQSKQIANQKSNFTNTKDQNQKNDSHQLAQSESYMQHQNILNSTILSDQQQNEEYSYFPTENSTQLLSMLALKKELNNAKRKFQNPTIEGKENRAKKQVSQGEYSFRNKQLFEIIPEAQGKSTSILSRDKSKKMRKMSSESQNKENRQKSVYQLVLQENRRQKLGTCK